MKLTIYLAALLLAGAHFPNAPVWAAYPGLGAIAGEGYSNPLITPQTIHDITITDIQSSSTVASQGDIVNIDVAVQNLGTGPETFTLSLRDDTDLREIDSITLTLNAAQSLPVGFRWDTEHASPRAHVLTATVTVPGDQNPGNNSRSLSSPISVAAVQVTFDLLALPDATFGGSLAPAQPGINTPAAPLGTVFLGNHDASHAGSLSRAALSTSGTSRQSIFVANADATFQPSAPLQDPFRQGEIRGVVHLEGNQSSLGAHVRVGQDTFFVDADGSFGVMTPGGTFDIFLHAPGHVPVRIPGASIAPGEVLVLPELTLPFGDANGDGRIDILDLSIAASNFGDTITEVPPP